jgi:hypothetical protein
MARTAPRGAASPAGYPIPAKHIAWCGGVQASRRAKWARTTKDRPALVRPGPLFTSHDAVETAVVAALAKVNQKVATAAWLAIRGDVRERLLAGDSDLWVLMSSDGPSHCIVQGATEAAETADSLGEALWTLRLAAQIGMSRQRFETVLASHRRSASSADPRVQGLAR